MSVEPRALIRICSRAGLRLRVVDNEWIAVSPKDRVFTFLGLSDLIRSHKAALLRELSA